MAALDLVRVLIVANDPLARTGLATLLAGQPAGRIDVVGQSAAHEQADLAAEVEVARPQATLWDLGWNPARGLAQLAEAAEGLPAIVALLPEDAGEQGYAAEAWSAGARGLLLRDADGEKLVAALHAVAHGLAVLDPAFTGDVFLNSRGLGAPGAALVEDLTARELEVLQLLAEGLPNKAIARQLGISDHTVKFHINAILGKLGAQSRTEAVVRATRLGLILL